MIKIKVLGCCVSREMFNYTDRLEVTKCVYTPFITLNEPPFPVDRDRPRRPQSLFCEYARSGMPQKNIRLSERGAGGLSDLGFCRNRYGFLPDRKWRQVARHGTL